MLSITHEVTHKVWGSITELNEIRSQLGKMFLIIETSISESMNDPPPFCCHLTDHQWNSLIKSDWVKKYKKLTGTKETTVLTKIKEPKA